MNLLVSYNWLKEYVKLKQTPSDFAARISLSGPSVERIHPQGQGLENVVVGLIKKVKPHPNADKLRVVETDLGKETKDIVCGGSNLKEGQLVAVALPATAGKPGARVRWHGEGEPVEIKITPLRGVESYGMICAANEIGLFELFPHAEREILDLASTKAKPGTPLAEALKLDDVIFDVEVTSNRPDAFSMLGMAREAAAIFGAPFLWKPATFRVTPAKAGARKSGKKKLPLTVKIEAKKLCPRYQALVMGSVKVGPSPDWLKTRLAAAGIRPINNLVDITNYVMLETGQPMHVFDYDKLKGSAIIVREAKPGEKMKALDGNVYELKPGQLVIADAERPVAIAGVMGGEETGVTETTKNIVFESASFDPVSVRRTARTLNLHSDSSLRFEKGLSTEMTTMALARATSLASDVAGDVRVGPVIDARAKPYQKLVFPFRPARAAELIGVEIPAKEMKRILTALGFAVSGPAAKWRVIVPFWRDHDIESERDLVEEVARVHGYGNLPSVMPDGILPLADPEPALQWEDRVKRLLKNWGCVELMTYSFISKALAMKAGGDPSKMLRLSNPLTEEFEYLRNGLIPSVLQVIAENQEEAPAGSAFELANVYQPRPGDLPVEAPRLAIAAWSRDERGGDLRKIKGVVEALMDELGIRGLKTVRDGGPGVWHPGRTVLLKVGDDTVGVLGELHPATLSKFGIERRVAAVNLDFSKVLSYASAAKFYAPIPAFPRVKRDIAFVVERHAEHEAVAAKLRHADALVRSVELFDVFEDAKLGAGKKSMAYHLEFGADDRTLKAEEVDRIMERLRETLKKEFGAEVRS